MDPFIGQISMFGFNWAPVYWSTCQGQVMQIQQNMALYSLLGTNFGGNGVQTFGLPDLQGRLPMGQGNGPGLSERTFAQPLGSEAALLTANQCATPLHTHTLTASNTPSASLTQAPASGWTPGAAASVTTGRDPVATNVQMYTSSPSGATAQSAPTSPPTGGEAASLPVGLINPALVLNFCIALNGVFPVRS